LKYTPAARAGGKETGNNKNYVLVHRNITANRVGRECYCGGDIMNDFETAAGHNNTPKGSGEP
jgi:hypothetical protein